MYPAVVLVTVLILSNCNFFGYQDSSVPEQKKLIAQSSLGRGYDVFDVYADSQHLKDPILDYDALMSNNRITYDPSGRSDFSSISGESYEEYLSSMSMNIKLEGKYLFFSTSLKQSFSSERFSSEAYEYATIKANIIKSNLTIRNRFNDKYLKPYLTEDFANDVNDPDIHPFTLFKTYGTHVITGIVMGARMDYHFSAKREEAAGSTKISAAAESSFNTKFASANAEFDFDKSKSYKNMFSEQETRTTVIGGLSEYGMGIHSDTEFKDWIDSIQDNPVFSDFYEDSLYPIWRLADAQERREEIEDAFDNWANIREYRVDPTPENAIIDIKVVKKVGAGGRGPSFTELGQVYYRINQDLTKKTGSDWWVYIYISYGPIDGEGDKAPITNIAAVHGSSIGGAKAQWDDDSYILLNHDLNKGAGGDYIYLVFTRDPAAGDPVKYLYTHNVTTDVKTEPFRTNDIQYQELVYDAVYWMKNKTIPKDNIANLNYKTTGHKLNLYMGR